MAMATLLACGLLKELGGFLADDVLYEFARKDLIG